MKNMLEGPRGGMDMPGSGEKASDVDGEQASRLLARYCSS
jgi:hypothetical protein